MPSDSSLAGLRGFLIDAPAPGKLRCWPDGAIVMEGGCIAELGDYAALSQRPRGQAVRWRHSERVAIFPGLIDLHAHLPHYPAAARPIRSIQDWWERLAAPFERNFTPARARREAGAHFGELARHGTTCALLFAGPHEEACVASFLAAAQSGLRLILGQTLADLPAGRRPAAPSAAAALQETARLCQAWHGAGEGLVECAVSPRSVAACSEELLRGAAAFSAERGVLLQLSLAELGPPPAPPTAPATVSAESAVSEAQPGPQSTDELAVLAACGVLGARSVIRAGRELSRAECETLSAAGAALAYCPSADLFQRRGLLRLDEARAAGLRIGLGSAAGSSPELNLWRVLRAAIEGQTAPSAPGSAASLSPGDALFLGTQGAADALGKGAQIGSFEIGKEADLVVIDFPSLLPGQRSSRAAHDLSAEDLVSLCICRAGPEAILETVVRGQTVFQAAAPGLF